MGAGEARSAIRIHHFSGIWSARAETFEWSPGIGEVYRSMGKFQIQDSA